MVPCDLSTIRFILVPEGRIDSIRVGPDFLFPPSASDNLQVIFEYSFNNIHKTESKRIRSRCTYSFPNPSVQSFSMVGIRGRPCQLLLSGYCSAMIHRINVGSRFAVFAVNLCLDNRCGRSINPSRTSVITSSINDRRVRRDLHYNCNRII